MHQAAIPNKNMQVLCKKQEQPTAFLCILKRGRESSLDQVNYGTGRNHASPHPRTSFVRTLKIWVASILPRRPTEETPNHPQCLFQPGITLDTNILGCLDKLKRKRAQVQTLHTLEGFQIKSINISSIRHKSEQRPVDKFFVLQYRLVTKRSLFYTRQFPRVFKEVHVNSGHSLHAHDPRQPASSPKLPGCLSSAWPLKRRLRLRLRRWGFLSLSSAIAKCTVNCLGDKSFC